MDYKYIEQLLDRYWNCETSPEEEAILRAFFSQSDVPVHLLRYKPLFAYAKKQAEAKILGEDFDRRVMEAIQAPIVKAHPLTLASRFSGLYKSAATVAVICLLGSIGHQMFRTSQPAGYAEPAPIGTKAQVAAKAALSDRHISMIDSTKTVKHKTTPADRVVTE